MRWVYRRPHDYRSKTLPAVLFLPPSADSGIRSAEPPFKIRLEQSRQHQQAIPLPWAAVEVEAEPYSAYKEPERAFRVEFHVQRQELPALDKYPANPLLAFDPIKGFHSIAFNVELRVAPAHDYWPANPLIAFDSAVRAITTGFSRERQLLPIQPEYPETPLGFFDGFWPGSARVSANQFAYKVRLQALPQLDVHPLAASIVPYPSYVPPLAIRSTTTVRRQHVPRLDEHPATPVPYPSYVPPSVHRSAFVSERVVGEQLRSYPATQAGFFDGFWPGSARVAALHSSFRISRQALPQLDKYPAIVPFTAYVPPAAFTSVFQQTSLTPLPLDTYPAAAPAAVPYPSYLPPAAFSSAFRRLALRPAQLDQYPAAPATPATLGAFLEKQAFSRRDIRRHLRLVPQLDSYPVTPPAENVWRLGADAPFVVRLHNSRHLQRALHVPYTPATTIFEATVPSGHHRPDIRLHARKVQAFGHPPDTPATPPKLIISGYPGSGAVHTFRVDYKVKLQDLAVPPVYPTTPAGPVQPYAAYAIIPKAHKWLQIGQYLQPNFLAVYRKTDPAYYTGWYPAAEQADSGHKTSFKVTRQVLAFPAVSPLRPSADVTGRPSEPPFRVRTYRRRKIQKLPALHSFPRIEPANEATVPPPTIRRRETARILQFPAQINVYPPRVAPPAPLYSSTVPPVVHIRKALNRKHRSLPRHVVFPRSAAVAPAIYTFIVPADENEFVVPVDVDSFAVQEENCIFRVPAENDDFEVK